MKTAVPTPAVLSGPQDLPGSSFHSGSTSALLDLSGLDLPPSGTTYPATPTHPGNQSSPEQPSASVSLLDDELMSLGKEEGSTGEEGGAGAACGHQLCSPLGSWWRPWGNQRAFPVRGKAEAYGD